MKKILASWNVNSVNARLPRVEEYLDLRQPDILCLQELKCTEDKFPWEPFRKRNYQGIILGQKSYNGVAILSTLPIEKFSFDFRGSENGDARIVGAKIHDWLIFSVYVPNGQEIGAPKFQYKLNWLRELNLFLKNLSKDYTKIIVTGDFNITPDDRDVCDPIGWKEKLHCSSQERQYLSELCDIGFSDSLRLFKQEAGLYSWWDYRQGSFYRDQGLRIDMVYISANQRNLCYDVFIDRDMRKGEKPSDHVPVGISFEIS